MSGRGLQNEWNFYLNIWKSTKLPVTSMGKTLNKINVYRDTKGEGQKDTKTI